MNRIARVAAAGVVLILAAKAFIGGIPWLTTMAAAKTLHIPRTKVMATRSVNPVVVELFTSEGCSSCPPADRVLSSLRGDRSMGKAGVIILEEHVDYWNHLGWKDPWSTSGFSDRQSAYANRLHLEGIYTPQMVVDGRSEFVGSDSSQAASAIANASKSAKANVMLATSTSASGQTIIKAHVDQLPIVSEKADVIVAVTEDGLQSHVTAGENSGTTLVHNGVVHSLRPIGQIKPNAMGAFDGQTILSVNPHWHKDRLTAVAFVQLRLSGRIIGAAAIPL